MASWAFVLTDRNFVPQGEILNANDRKVALPLSKLATASFKVRMDNPLADQLMTTQGYLKAYRKTAAAPWALKYMGPLISSEMSGERDKGSISVNSVGAAWVLGKRFAGKSATGTVFSTLTDRAQISKALIDTANAESETHLDTTLNALSAASAVTYTAGPYKPVSECIQELATAYDGFDWFFDPIDNFAAGSVTGTKIASLRAAPVIGSTRSEAVFEWGTGRNNITTFKWQVGRDTQANKVYHNTSNGPDAAGFPTVSALDTASISNWGLLEELANADLLDASMRQNLVNEHVNVRKNPRQVIEFTPHIDPYDAGRLPLYGVDYGVGDTVRARVALGGPSKFDAAVRVYGVTFDINDLGIEQQALSLVQET